MTFQMKLDKRFARKVVGRYETVSFECGILRDKPYRTPRSKKFKATLAGGPVRQKKFQTRGMISDVSEAMRKRTDFYRKPFEKDSPDYRKFRRLFFNWLARKGNVTRKSITDALQAIVRNPILKNKYGSNAPSTIKTKGFDRFFFDTGQLFQAIKAKLSRRR